MWLSVFIVFSLIIFVWVQSFQQKLTFLLNPPQENAAMAKQESPFAVIGKSFNDLRATILDLFGLAAGTKKEVEVKNSLEERFGVRVEPRLLPLSEDKSDD